MLDMNLEKIKNDDIALIISPNFTKNSWNTTVDINAIVMPIERLKKEEQQELKDIMYALVTCFNLLNTDNDFAKRVANEMDKMNSAEFEEEVNGDSVFNLSTWTKTVGNA
tara:strand:+ start:509 stop:838 length:330 start_codon:yes stop_codon:yes gene_type:complete